MDVERVELEGNRVLYVGTYTLTDDDGEHTRVFVSTGWASVPPTPLAETTVDVAAGSVGDLIAALERVEI